jgi:hypothetical protein
MFGWFKRDPIAALRTKYEARTQEAMNAQRRGDIKGFAVLSAEAAALWEELEAAEAGRAAPK